MSDFEIFDLGETTLACGVIVPSLRLAYRVYGELNADRSSPILYPSSCGAKHTDIDWLIGPDRVLDPTTHCSHRRA